MDMYAFVTYKDKDIKKIIDNLKWELTSPSNMDDETEWLLMCCTPKQYFGATDYSDHRNDTLEQLKELIMPNLKSIHQRVHFYNKDGVPYNTIVVRGSYGGYTGWLKESNVGRRMNSTERRSRIKKRKR